MTIDFSKLWDFNNPELSEQRFRSALAEATADDAIILKTQIARTFGLRKNFAQARQILVDLETQIQGAGSEAKVQYYLELGRTYASATHSPESQTTEAKELARSAYMQAFEAAKSGKLDGLAVDALHMLTLVDTSPEDQVKWNHRALEFMQSSSQPEAKKWEASLRNNLGYALHLMERYEEALAEFRLALTIRERDGNPQTIRIAYWMIAWTLRAQGHLSEALEIQLRLEKECDEAGEPDPYVFEELELLYKALNKDEKAEFYAARKKAAQ